MKLWINEHDFIETDDKKSLSSEIAPRSRSIDWMGIMGFLPDPDPILIKLGQDITVYRQLLSDAHVFSCAQSRKAGTLSCEWEILEPAQGSARTNKRARQAIEDMMNQLDVYQIITDMLEAPFFGMSPLEVMWKSGKNWLPERVTGKPPEWFQFDPENILRFKSIDNLIEGEDLPPYKFLLPRHHASYQNPYGERVLSRCFWPVTFKRGGFKFWAIFTEKYGMPWIIGKVPRQTNETERGQLLARLVDMVQDAAAVVNNDESIEITEAGGKTASADIYEKLISVSNREISKAILGQTLTTELDKGGSFAAAKEHMEVRADLVDQDKQMIKSAFNLLFSWVVELNFPGSAPPGFGFYEKEDIQNKRSERDERLERQGIKFTASYYRRSYNLQEDDFELKKKEEQTNNKTEFVEGDDDISASPDIIAEKALAEASMDKEINTAKKLLEKAATLEEFQDGLLDLYRDVDESSLGDLMQKAMTLADLTGRFDADVRR